MTIARSTNVLLLVTVCAAGCDRVDPNIPHVVYPDQLPLPAPKHVIDVPDWTVGEPSLDLAFAAPALVNDPVEFRGRVIPTADVDLHGDVVVAIVRDGEEGRILGNLAAEMTKHDDGAYSYSVILKAPPWPQRWRVEISWRHFEAGTHPLAVGELEVQEP